MPTRLRERTQLFGWRNFLYTALIRAFIFLWFANNFQDSFLYEYPQ